jgi:hypothetical protein
MVKKMVVVPYEMVRHLIEPEHMYGPMRRLEEDRENRALNLRFKDDFGPKTMERGQQTVVSGDQQIQQQQTPMRPIQESAASTPMFLTPILETPKAPKKKSKFEGPFSSLKKDLKTARIINAKGEVMDTNQWPIQGTDINAVLQYAQNPNGSPPSGANVVGKWMADSGKSSSLISADFVNKYKVGKRVRKPPKSFQLGSGLKWKTFWKGF